MKKTVMPGGGTVAIMMFLFLPALLHAHIADEIAVKTTVELTEGEIIFSFDISSGVLFSTAFLKMLDPDKNKIFEEPDIGVFSEFFLGTVEVDLNGKPRRLGFKNFSASEWDFFAAGISTIVLNYSLENEIGKNQIVDLRYELSFYPETTVYSLKLINNSPLSLAILKERRNEYLQDVLEIQYTADPVLAAELAAAVPAAGPAETLSPGKGEARNFFRDGFEIFGIMDSIRGTNIAGKALIPLLVLAVAVGFLHGFTPGHGKALVGAFLIANQGTGLHAFFLGIVLTLTHTISIYGFGLLASLAAGFFLPGELIPLLSLLCGLFIMFIGIRGFFKRIMGTGMNHAHLLPNLQILRTDTVNILIDGQASEANEALLIAQEDELVQESLKAVGAENFTLCSPGCSVHGRLPAGLLERRRAEFLKLAIKTGAVDAVVARSDRTLRDIEKFKEGICIQKSSDAVDRPREILFNAIRSYSVRGDITMLENKLSWLRVISLGVTGGLVPCPDALAVLLLAVAAGKTALGMGIIFFFSLGLAAALILVGMLFIMTKLILARRQRFAAVTQYLPYMSSLVITILGFFMIMSSVVF